MFMVSLPVVLSSALLCVAFCTALLGLVVASRPNVPGTRSFVVLTLAVAIWSLSYGLELPETDLKGKLVWARVGYLGSTTVPVAWLALSIRIARLDRWYRKSVIAAAAVIPFFTLVAALSPHLSSRLLWLRAELREVGRLTLLKVEHGQLFWIFAAYGYSVVILGALVIIVGFLRQPGVFAGQRFALTLACAAPMIGSVFYVTGRGPIPELDLTPFAFAVSGGVFGWSLLRHGFPNVIPIARERIIQSMEDMVLVLDRQGRVVEINPAALAALGSTPKEAIGRSADEVLASQQQLVERFRSTFETRTEIAVDIGEKRRWFDLRITPLRTSERKLEGRLVTLRDLSQRKKAEQELQTNEERYRSILENIEEGYFELDLSGKLLTSNAILAKIAGFPPERMSGLHYKEYTSPDTAALLRDTFSRVYATGIPVRDLKHEIVRADGSAATVALSAIPRIDESGNVVGFRGLVHDITDRTKTEDALREAQERISDLIEAASEREDLAGWATATACELSAALGGRAVGAWSITDSSIEPLAPADLELPPLEEIRALSSTVGPAICEFEKGALVPVLATTGELQGVLVLEARQQRLEITERRMLLAFARQLGAALEMRHLRLQLANADARRLLQRSRMKERGVTLLRLCMRCRRCYPDTTSTCDVDEAQLGDPHALPYRLVDRYRFTSLLGTGGMGMVLSAQDEKLGREVAIKLVRPDHFESATLRRRFDQEARSVARIQHPGVIALFDVGELDDGTMFLVVERLNGCDLATVFWRHGRGTHRQVARLARQASSAINAAHSAGVVHRDIKPANLFLVEDGASFRVKILDFGLAKPLGRSRDLTMTGTIVGTPAYMAPELIEGDTADARSDLYSLGCVAYEALTGRRAARGDRLGRILLSVLREVPPIPSSLVNVSREVDDLMRVALEKERAHRPENIEDWGTALSLALESCPDSPAKGWPASLTSIEPQAEENTDAVCDAEASTASWRADG